MLSFDMDFVKEFAVFLHRSGIIRFGDYTLASGKKSPYYIDLRQVPSYPHEFRRMVRYLGGMVGDWSGVIASVPTGGLIIASALAMETARPLIYTRDKPKDYGTTRSVEGVIRDRMDAIIIDDVTTTGSSVVRAVGSLRKVGVSVDKAFVIVDRLEGASEALAELEVRMHSVVNVLQIAKILHRDNLVDETVLNQISDRVE